MKAGKVLEEIGISRLTLKKWREKGKIKYQKLENGQFDYDENSVKELKIKYKNKIRKNSKTICYLNCHYKKDEVLDILKENKISINDFFLESKQDEKINELFLLVHYKKVKRIIFLEDDISNGIKNIFVELSKEKNSKDKPVNLFDVLIIKKDGSIFNETRGDFFEKDN